MIVSIDEKARTMTVVIPLLDTPRFSSSLKGVTVVTSGGAKQTSATFKGHPVTVSMNAYIPSNLAIKPSVIADLQADIKSGAISADAKIPVQDDDWVDLAALRRGSSRTEAPAPVAPATPPQSRRATRI